ncbi:MAG: substrate-binding domain-containing protein [Bacteroidia bacterium]|nr:substrate-binding domain-containing protein [Bacteroidia bacterium]
MKKRIRIKDIAERAQVSRGTVDRVLHNRGNVAPEIKQKIQEVLEELNYERNIIASTLAYNRMLRIGILLPDYSEDPFWEEPKNGIDTALKSVEHYGVTVQYYLFDQDDTRSFVRQSELLLEDRPDAILLAPDFFNESMEFLEKCQRRGIPYIQINTHLARKESCNLGYIGQDTYQSGVLAGRLLSYLIPPNSTVGVLHLEKGLPNAHHLIEKEKGFRDFFSAHNEGKTKVVQLAFSPFGERQELFDFLDKNLLSVGDIRGLMVTTSRIFLLATYLQERALDHISLVGFDLIEKNIQLLENGKIQFLINQNPFKQGYYGIMNIVEHLIKKSEVESMRMLPLDIAVKENVQYYVKATRDLRVVV